MEISKDWIARVIFVQVDNTLSSPEHSSIQRAAQTIWARMEEVLTLAEENAAAAAYRDADRA